MTLLNLKAIEDRDIAKLVVDLEDAELQASEATYSAWPVAVHLMGLLILGRLEDARALWRRVPAAAKTPNHGDAQAAFHCLQHLWNRDYPGFWSAIEGFQWAGPAAAVAAVLKDETRNRVLALIERCFTTIDAPKAGALLHISAQDLSDLATKRGWTAATVNGQTLLQLPKVAEVRFSNLSEADLERFSEYVLALES